MDGRRLRPIISGIYDVIADATAHRYSDEAWEGVYALTNIIANKLEKLGEVYGHVFDLDVHPVNGGYRRNTSGDVWKEYVVDISDETEEKVIAGVITCSPCGTVADIWKSYDMSVVLWRNIISD